MKKPLVIAAVIFAGLCVCVVVLGVFWFFSVGSKIGGLSPAYNAADGDPTLTGIARSARPLMQALEKYHHEHHEFPAQAAALVPYLPAAPTTPAPTVGNIILGWNYHCDDAKKTYRLSHGLGWDPSLIYSFDGSTGHWEFDPGDGQETKAIQLNP